MTLQHFLELLPRGTQEPFARHISISVVYLRQLAKRVEDREPAPELCVRIEEATGHRVRRWDLRPNDWHLIWPELVGLAGAPHVVRERTALFSFTANEPEPKLAAEAA